MVNTPVNGYNRALLGRYPPGSTFKVVTAGALLAGGLRPGDPVDCPKEAKVGGRTFGNFEDEVLGRIPFASAFAHSCNTAFVQQAAKRLDGDELVDAAAQFGFGLDPSPGIPAVTSRVPAPSDRADLAAEAFGQGRVTASPLQMALVAATVAEGRWRQPRLVAEGDGGSPAEAPDPLDAKVAGTLRTLMRQVVTEGTAAPAGLPGKVAARPARPSSAPATRCPPTPGSSASAATWPSRWWSRTAASAAGSPPPPPPGSSAASRRDNRSVTVPGRSRPTLPETAHEPTRRWRCGGARPGWPGRCWPHSSASVAALVVLSVANGNFQRQPLANTVGLLLAFAAFMGVGALIVANRPGNAIGWVFSAIALLAVTGALAEEYAGYAVRTRPGLLPGGVLAGWYAGWAWYPTVALALVFTPLLFPDGRPPSPPWRLVAWLAGAVTALFAALAAVQPTIELDDGHVVDNPIGVAGAR